MTKDRLESDWNFTLDLFTGISDTIYKVRWMSQVFIFHVLEGDFERINRAFKEYFSSYETQKYVRELHGLSDDNMIIQFRGYTFIVLKQNAKQ